MVNWRHQVSLLLGLAMAICFVAIATLPVLRGASLRPFVVLFLLTGTVYAMAVFRLEQSAPSLRAVWVFAVVFRLTLLLSSPPSLSDDVYRYIWDGRLLNSAVNPYAHVVDSPALDYLDSPQRRQVNNAWMASPYLPASQVLFATVYRVAPDNPLAFQVTALLLDLLTGWLVVDMLRRLYLPRARVLLYLWNPLVVVEFAHGAHVDALMICLMMLSLWALVVERQSGSGSRAWIRQLVSPVALAAATLTKGIPALLLSVVIWPWRWRRALIYVALIVAVLLPVGLDAGFGLFGERDGEGLFGALRIYGARWNYNSGFYHWLEVVVSGYRTPGAVPPEVVGEAPIRAAKAIAAMLLTVVLAVTAWWARRCHDALGLVRSAMVPLGAYLVLTTTVHPWYVAIVVPLLAFLLRREGEGPERDRLIWPWIYLSVVVSLSYLTYLDPANLREYDWVRMVEYLPFYALLIWSAWSTRKSTSSVSSAP